MFSHRSLLRFTVLLAASSTLSAAAPTPWKHRALALYHRNAALSFNPPSSPSSSEDDSGSSLTATSIATEAVVVLSAFSTSFSVILSATDVDFAAATGSPSITIIAEAVLTTAVPPAPEATAAPSGSYVDAASISSTSSMERVLATSSGTESANPTSSAWLTAQSTSPIAANDQPTGTTLYLPATSVPPVADTDSLSSLDSSSSATASYAYFSDTTVVPTATAFDDPNPPSNAPEESPQQSRRSALIAAFTALGVFATMGITVLIVRCRVVSRVKRLRRSWRDSDANLVWSDSYRARMQSPSIIVTQEKDVVPGLPDLCNAPYSPSVASEGPATPRPVSPGQPWSAFSTDGPYEDVTHVLSSDRTCSSPGEYVSVVWEDSPERYPGQARERGPSRASDVTTDTYISADSRYSNPSTIERTRRSQDTSASVAGSARASADSNVAVLSFLDFSSPPATPLPAGKDITQGDVLNTFTPSPSPPPKPRKTVRFPSEVPSEDWDIAAAYARSSAGGSSILSDVQDGDILETVEVGGRVCVLVQGC